jgi:hypothetical protein
VSRYSRLRWMLTRCAYCKRRILLSPFMVIAKNPAKSWDQVAIHDFECRPARPFMVAKPGKRGAP